MCKTADIAYLSVIRNTTPQWGNYAHVATQRNFKKNDVLLYVGQIPKYLYYVMQGEFCFKFVDIEGREQTVQYVGEKSLVGETFFIMGCPVRTTVVCTSSATVLSFTREQVLSELLPNDPELLQGLLVSLAHKVIFNSNRRLIEEFDSIQARICNLFFQHLQRNALGECIIRLPWNYNELSLFLGIHRVTLYKTIKDLEKRGIWKKQRLGEFRVLNLEALQRVALNMAVTT